MPSQFSSGKHAIAECDRCGFRYKLKELRQLVIKTKNVNILVCNTCWEPDQPQLSLGLYPVNDPQAVRNPRPDTSYYAPGNNGAGGSRVIQWGWAPVGGSRSFDAPLTPNTLVSQGQVGSVTIGADNPDYMLLQPASSFDPSGPYNRFGVGLGYNGTRINGYDFPRLSSGNNFGYYVPYPPVAAGLNNTPVIGIYNNYIPSSTNWTVGLNSIDAGNNSNLVYGTGSTNYVTWQDINAQPAVEYVFYRSYLFLSGDVPQTATGKITIDGTDYLFSTALRLTNFPTFANPNTLYEWTTPFPWGLGTSSTYTITFTA